MVSQELVRRALEKLKRASDYKFFFEQLGSPDWIEPLRAEGFFAAAPEPVTDGSYIRYPAWPESAYLARVAAEAPALVRRVIEEMPSTANLTAQSDLVRAAANMPSTESIHLLDRISGWVGPRSRLYLEGPVLSLVESLFRGGELSAALGLALSLIALPSVDRKDGTGEATQDHWQVEHVLEQLIPLIPAGAALEAATALAELLSGSLAEPGVVGPSPARDGSHIWRPAIRAHSQNRHHDPRSAVVDAIRDLYLQVGSSRPADIDHAAVDLFARRWAIFIRIAMFLCSQFPDRLTAKGLELVLDERLFHSIDVRHEYYWLTRDLLTVENNASALAEYLALVENGPPQWLVDRFAGTPEDEPARWAWWIERLHPVRDVLPTGVRRTYMQRSAVVGEPAHPDFPFFMSEVQRLTGDSPLPADTMSDLSADAIFEFLASWRPEGGPGSSTIEGLGRSLASAVKRRPELFASAAEAMPRHEPTYVRCLLSGLRDALSEDKRFEWEPILRLGLWVLEQSDSGFDRDDWNQDPDWSWARRALADLLGAGLQDCENTIPVESRSDVWRALKILAEDPQPSPEYEDRYGGANMDPLTLSFNTIRGSAFHALVHYLEWIRIHLDEPGLPEELRDLLEKHLDVETDPSVAVRSVYGWGLGSFLNADPEWASSKVNRIFPDDPELRSHWEAAWTAFLMRWNPSRAFLDFLYEQYLRAIDHLSADSDSSHSDDSENRLAQHLLSLYWWGALDLGDGGLLDQFLARASDRLRSYVIHEVGRALADAEDTPGDVIQRCVDLWESRIAAAQQGSAVSHEAELSAFISWFRIGALEPGWLLDQALSAFGQVDYVDHVFGVVEKLAEYIDQYPEKTLKLLKLLLEKDRWGHVVIGQRVAVRQTLETALSMGPQVRSHALGLLNWMVARGLEQYVDLLERSVEG